MDALFTFGVMYVMCGNFTMELRMEQQMCIKFVAHIRKSVMKTLAVVAQVFKKEHMSHICVFEWHARYKASQTSIDNGDTGGPSAPLCPTVLPKFNSSFMRIDIDIEPFVILLMRWELLMRYVNEF